jgi:hypothetical protein
MTVLEYNVDVKMSGPVLMFMSGFRFETEDCGEGYGETEFCVLSSKS